MTTTHETSQQMIDAVSRRITTPHGFRLRIPIAKVHPAAPVIVKGSTFDVLWRRAEKAVNSGYPVRFAAPRSAPRAHISYAFYGRCLTRSMLYALMRLKQYHDRHPETPFAHRKDFRCPGHGDWARLRHWGLIEARPLMPDEKPGASRGWWRLTGLGIAWLRGRVKIPRQAAVFDGVSVGFIDSADLIGPTDVDDEFSFEKLMGAA